MPIPDFQTLMLPLLEALADGRERLVREVTASLADRFSNDFFDEDEGIA